MSEQSNWETDFRWRRVRVSSQFLSAFLSGQTELAYITTAPPDLVVVGLTDIQTGPGGSYEFLVWSATFEPTPNDGTRPNYPILEADFEYST